MKTQKVNFIVQAIACFLGFASISNQRNISSLMTLSTDLNSLSNNTVSRLAEPLIAERRIGILAWGSLVNDPRDLKIKDQFKKSSFKLPIQLSRLSGKGTINQRLTRIIDKDMGVPISIWHTTSQYNLLPDARENLRIREGSTLSNIFYIKTLLPTKTPDSHEKVILDEHGNRIKNNNGNDWYILESGLNQLSRTHVIALAKWASAQGYDAVLWTGLGKTSGYTSLAKLKTTLNDQITLKNTKAYISNLPDQNELTQFEKEILIMRS